MVSLIYCGLVMSIFCFGGSLAVSDEMKEMAKMLHDTCVGETGVDEGTIAKANAGEFSEDNKLKCYMRCIMDQVSALTDEGDIDVDVLASIIPEEMAADVEPIIRSCGTVKGADECDTVFQTQKCYYDKNPKLYFLL